MKTFPAWIIIIGAVGLGFFAFVITGGVLLKIAASAKLAGLFVILVSSLLSLAAAYFAFKFSRKFMMRHVSRNAEPGDIHFSEGRTASQKRIALAMLLSGVILFPAFVFVLISSIIKAYV
jgi:hypothetical protein